MFDFAQRRGGRIKLLSRRTKRKLFSYIFVGTIAAIFIMFFSVIGLFAWYAKDLPNPAKILRKEGYSTIIFDRNGKVLYDIFADQNRIPAELNDIPKHLEDATVAIEDKEFYQHEGYSTKGIGRAVLQIIFFHNLQGGSTLTQQLVKNVLLTDERTVSRKIKEFILAVQIERKYSKDEILQMYLNEAPYGGTAWGVESASQMYFAKPMKELTLTEAAILAGFPQRPSVYSPYSDQPNAYIERTKQVLRRMREDGYITKAVENESNKELPDIAFKGKESNFKAPHFVMYVKNQLIEQFGEQMVEQGGLRVTTTIDLDIQEKAEKIIKEELEKVKNLKVGNSAVMVIDPQDGNIIAMVGSKDYHAEDFEGKFNVATQGLRQPGSTLKPITYAVAFTKGYTPASLVMDVLTEFPGGEEEKPYKPENYDGKYRGPMQFRFALGNSINVAAVKVLAWAGLHDMLKVAYAMGLTTLEPTTENMARFGLSVTLGGGEVRLIDLTSAFGVFANGGIRHEPVAILKVTDTKGKTLFEHRRNEGEKRVLTTEVSFLISHILSDNNARRDVFGPNSWLNIPGKTVAVKTGTTDDKRDNWAVGFTKEVAVGVWVGNNNNSPMDKKLASGVTGAAPIWNRIMRECLSKFKDGIIDKPDDVIALHIDSLGGGLPKDENNKRSEYFIKDTEPTTLSSIYQRLKLSRRQAGRLANNDEIRAGEYEEKDYVVFAEDDPVSGDGRNHWQEGIDNWLNENKKDDQLYRPPHDTSDAQIEPSNTPKPEEPASNVTSAASDVALPTQTPVPTFTPTPSPTPIL